MKHGMASMSAADFSQIKEFHFQTRRYEWVEFRNVSLQLGHRTSVEMVDAPGLGDAGDSTPAKPTSTAAAANPTAVADLQAAQTERALPRAAKLWEELDQAEKAMRRADEEIHEFQKSNNIGFLRDDANSAGKYLGTLHRQLADLKTEFDRLKRDAAAGDKTENASKQAAVRIQIENLEGTIKIWEGKALDLAHRIADWDKYRSKQERTRGLYLQKIAAIRCARVNRNPEKDPGSATLVSPRFSNPAFGPVIEHPFPMKDDEAWGWNLASGKIENSTEARPLSFDSTGEAKLRESLVDLYEPPKHEGRILRTLDAGLVPLGEDGWNTAPLVAMMQLEEAGKLLMVRPEVSAAGGEVYAFVTREGATGVLQIVTGSPRKLRYKLVQDSPVGAKTLKPIPPEALAIMDEIKALPQTFAVRDDDPDPVKSILAARDAKAEELAALLRGTVAQPIVDRTEELKRELSNTATPPDAARREAINKEGEELEQKLRALAHPAAAKSAEVRGQHLQFRLVAGADDADAEGVSSRDGNRQFRLRRDVLLDDAAVADAKVRSTGEDVTIDVIFTEAGGKRFAEITGANVGRQLAIVFDSKVLSAPTLLNAIVGGHAQITGKFTAGEAETIAAALAPSRTEPAKSDAAKPAPADPVPGIEAKAMQQLLEKTVSEMSDVHRKLAEQLLTMKETHPAVIELRTKLKSLEQEAERLRGILRQGAAKQ